MAKSKRKVISMPLYIEMGVKKIRRHYINLNHYRNWHYQVSNNIKKAYKELVLPQIEGLSFEKIELKLTFYPRDKRRIDRSNYLSIHEKFFCDALVESGSLEDDNDAFLVATHYHGGPIDKENPRVEIEITEVI